MRGEGVKICLFLFMLRVWKLSKQGGGGGQKMAKFCPRSSWMPPKIENLRSLSHLLCILSLTNWLCFEQILCFKWFNSFFSHWVKSYDYLFFSLSASLFLTRSCDHNLSKSTLICMVEDAHLCWHITVGQKWSSWVMTFATWQLGNSIFSDQLPPPFNDGQ